MDKGYIYIGSTLQKNRKQNASNRDDFKKNFMVPFYGWGSTASRLVPILGGSLLFTTKFPK